MAKLEDHLPYALRQFETEIVVPISLFGFDLSLSTASTAKIATLVLVCVYMIWAMRERAIVPGRLQASAEMLYTFVGDMVVKVAGPEAKSSIPFIFSLFVFILFGTLLGLTPIKDTFTSHLAVTLGLALIVFVYVNVMAIRTQGTGFFRLFLPVGLPIFVAPIFVLVEVLSYLFRPITLAFRLFANIVAGHVMLKLFGDFCAMMIAAMGPTGVVASLGPVMVMAVLYGCEVMIVCIQAYIFALISSVYLKDALHAH